MNGKQNIIIEKCDMRFIYKKQLSIPIFNEHFLLLPNFKVDFNFYTICITTLPIYD